MIRPRAEIIFSAEEVCIVFPRVRHAAVFYFAAGI